MINAAQSTKLPIISIDRLVFGGQGLGELPGGKKVFVWNALPGETVAVRLLRQKRTMLRQ